MLRLLHQEKKFLLGKPWVFLSWILLTLLVVLAMREGSTMVESRQAAVQQYSQDIWDTFEERRGNAQEVLDGVREVNNARDAYGAGRVNGIEVATAMEISPLQAWSPGLWDSHPTVGTVGVFTSPSDYLELASPRDPEAEGWGRLDLTTLVVILLPLWLLLVFHDTGSHERDRGLFRILEGNGVLRRRIVARRWGTPIAIALVGWISAFLVGCLVTGSWTGVGSAGWQWFGASLGYALFWMGCFAWIASRAHSTETSVLGALTAWVAVVILLPGLMDVVLRATSDPAAGVESVSGQRASAAEAEKERAEVLDKYMFDHPELAEEEEGEFASAFLRDYFITQESVETRLKPVLDRQFEKTEEDLTFVGALSSLVPSAWAQGLMESSAGTDPRHMLSFRRQSRTYAQGVRESLRPFLWSGQLLEPADFDAIPRFVDKTESPSMVSTVLRFLWLPVLGLLGLILAWREWMKVSVVR
ncbi:MAG: DUF3526 domain-containing protein [Planctomycetota bacterium]|nr:DUF3526 domain-containing protein [Planctomycetota bacterium]